MSKLAQLVKKEIEKKIGYLDWAQKFVEFEGINAEGEAAFFCLAHEHTHDTRSASFNTTTGLWHCFSSNCSKPDGDIIDLYRLAKGIKNNAQAIRELARELEILKEIDDQVVLQHHQFLFSNTELVQRVGKILGISPATLRHFKIGWMRGEPGPSRITIPIRDVAGEWVDIRRYNPNTKPKYCHWARGHGGVRCFPVEALQIDEIVLAAGEKDLLRMWDFGIKNALTFTGGEGSLPDDWGTLFKGKIIYVCYDIDKAGVKGSREVAQKLARVAHSVSEVRLTREGLPENGDFSDWANLGHTLQDWRELLQEAEQVQPSIAPRVEEAADTSEPIAVTFADLQSQSFYNQPIRLLGHALGNSQGTNLYQSPSCIELFCSMDQEKLCTRCALKALNPEARPWQFEINPRKEESLRLIRTTDIGQNLALRSMYHINRRCEVVTIEPKDRRQISHLMICPAVELAEMRENYSGYLSAFYHGEPIAENRDYYFTGYLQADPKEQRSVLNIHTAEPARNAIDHFVVNDEVLEAVEWFRPGPGVTVAENLERLHAVIEADTGIWGQPSLQQAFLDSIYSVLEFDCGNHRIANGWVEVLIIGDSGLGKTSVGRRMLKMINVGEVISGENVSAAGLIGGVETLDKTHISKWGAIPRNHRGVIVIDEIDEMQRKNRDVIGQLTALRSSGIAEINKIVHDRTPAQVRMIWITNPEEGRTVRSFNGACRAIMGVIKSRQDIARFTKIYAVAGEEISVETITQNRPLKQLPGVRKHFNNLAILVWSLKPEQIQFSAESVELLRRETRRLTDKYHESLPLLEKGRAFDKLAKLSVPIAALSGSFKEEDNTLSLAVDTSHVQYAIWHLEKTYDATDMNYLAYSIIERERERIPDERSVIGAMQAVSATVGMGALCRYLLNPTLSLRQLSEFSDNKVASEALWSKLLSNNCITFVRSMDTAQKTGGFVDLLNRLLIQEKEHAVPSACPSAATRY